MTSKLGEKVYIEYKALDEIGNRMRGDTLKEILTDAETQGLAERYTAGSEVALVIGIRNSKRTVVTAFRPLRNEQAQAEQIGRVVDKLKRLGCNGYIRSTPTPDFKYRE